MVKEGFRFGGWAVAIGAIAIVVAIVIGLMAVFGFGFFQRGTADFRGKTQEIEQTKANASFRIYSYNHFFDLCVSVQNKEKAIIALEEELKATHPSEEREGQIYANITANKIAREESINQYNADARKENTIGQFRSSDLPVEINSYEKETQCK